MTPAHPRFDPSAAPLADPPIQWGRVVIFLGVIFLYWSSMYVYVPILPVYARELGASLTIVGLLVGAYGFSQMILRLPLGIFSDRTGQRRIFLSAGFIAAGLGALGLGLAPTVEWMIVARGIVGVAAATWVTSTVLFTAYFPPRQVARAVGILSFSAGMSSLISTTVGGQVAEWVGPQMTFLSGTAIALIGFVLTFFVVEHRGATRAPPTGAAIVATMTVPTLLLVSITASLSQYAAWAATYAFVPIQAALLGASRADLGILTGVSLALQTIAALWIAILGNRVAPRTLILAGLALMAASIAVVPAIGDLTLLIVCQAIGGAGRGFAQTSLMSEAVRAVDPERRATAMGVFQAVYAVGMFVGPATAGVLGDVLDLGGAFHASAAIVALGIPLSLAAARLRA